MEPLAAVVNSFADQFSHLFVAGGLLMPTNISSFT
jgi:hypothetical protein